MLNILKIGDYNDFIYDGDREYFNEYYDLIEIKVKDFNNLKLNINGHIEVKNNWGEIFVFEYDNKKLFIDSYSPYKNEYIVYEYSNDYSCDIYGLMTI